MLTLLTWIAVAISHIGIWCIAFNRTHATALPRKYRKIGEKLVILMVLLPVIGVVWTVLRTWDFSLFGDSIYATSALLYGYCLGCLVIFPYFALPWFRRKFLSKNPITVENQTSRLIDLRKDLGIKLTGEGFGDLLDKIPGNQSTKLQIEEVNLKFGSFPNELNGLKIVQLSDLHLTGQLKLEYFQAIVKLVNEQNPDLIFITGDLVDEQHCLEWIEPIFGKLKATHGVFYIFGNHDMRIKDEADYRRQLADAGMTCVGGQWHILEIGGKKIGLAGNELPWFKGAEALPLNPPEDVDFKILLSHSPDQLEWAAPYNFDFMLAGHTHGGQIQFPLVGPIVAPSKFGVKYADGNFQIGNMFMHVSRGISGDEAIRINCPPELGVFTVNSTTIRRVQIPQAHEVAATVS